jgi:hypothetical protein
MAMAQQHCFKVCELSLAAQAIANGVPAPGFAGRTGR